MTDLQKAIRLCPRLAFLASPENPRFASFILENHLQVEDLAFSEDLTLAVAHYKLLSGDTSVNEVVDRRMSELLQK